MQTGIGEGAFPVMAGLKWRKTYHLILQTPLAASDVVTSTITLAPLIPEIEKNFNLTHAEAGALFFLISCPTETAAPSPDRI